MGFTVDELREMAREALASGPSARATTAEVKAEARRRHQAKV